MKSFRTTISWIVISVLCFSGTCAVRAGCNSASGSPLTINITVPTANQKLVLSALNTTIVTLTASSSGGTDSNLKWTAAGFNFPSGNSGTSVAINRTSWPTDNSFFGEKEIKLNYDGGVAGSPGDCEATRAIKVFFNPDAVIDSEPAWYKYWNGVISDLGSFEYQQSITDEDGNTAYGECDITFYSMETRAVCSLRVSEIAPTAFEDGGADKVDSVFMVVKHELGHKYCADEYARKRKVFYDAWIEAIEQNPHQEGTEDSDTYLSQIEDARDEGFLSVDSDGDKVPDDIDPDSGFDDQEFYAESYAYEQPYDVVVAEEWSDGGKNDQ